jgi:hypothetical protein
MPWGHDFRTPIPAATTNVSQLGRMWAYAMGYIFLQNAGISFHDPTSTFFQADRIEPTIVAEAATFQYVHLGVNAITTTNQLGPLSAVAAAVFQHIESNCDSFYMAIAPTTPTPPLRGSFAGATPVGPDNQLAEATRNLSKPPPSRRNQEAAKEVASVSAFYSIL